MKIQRLFKVHMWFMHSIQKMSWRIIMASLLGYSFSFKLQTLIQRCKYLSNVTT